MDIAERLSKLTPEQNKLLEVKLKRRQAGIEVLGMPITRVERRDSVHFPLSFAQERLWFVDRLAPGNAAYNIVRATKLHGSLDIPALEKSIDEIVRRHEILRTTFLFDNDEPRQVIHPSLSVLLPLSDLKGKARDEQESEVTKIKDRESLYTFDLEKGPLLRAHLLELSSVDHVFLLVIHHIVSDGISTEIFLSDLIRLYRSYSRGEASGLPVLPVQYVDYASWQRRWTAVEKYGEYWLNEFKGDVPVLEIPVDHPRPLMQSFEGDIVYFQLDAGMQRALKETASREKTTLFVLLLALYNIFLSKISGMEDIVVGSPVAGRRHRAVQGMIGIFINTLALRNFPEGEKCFGDFLAEVRVRTLKAFENQEFRYEDIVDKVAVVRDTGRNPLFDVVFVMQNQEAAGLDIPGLSLSPLPYQPRTSKFDLSFEVIVEGDSLRFSFEYCTALFKEETMRRFTRYFINVVSAVVRDPDSRIGEIDVIDQVERERLLSLFNTPGVTYPEDKTIHRLFEEQALRNPDRVALHMSHESHRSHLSYSLLNRAADRLASLLRERGIVPGTIAAMLTERSFDMIIGILAILKAGGVYLPIDPDTPRERVDYLLADSGAKVLLVNSDFENLDFEKGSPCRGLVSDLSSSNLAYVIYTSGTTGRPKGVLIEHRNVVQLMFNNRFSFDFGERDTWTLFHSYNFDFSVWEMYGALLFGGKLRVIPKMVARDATAFLKILREECVTVLNQTPSSFYHLSNEEMARSDSGLSLRYIIFGGEALAPGRLKEWRDKYPRVGLINMYGITETTVHVTYKEIGESEIALNESNIGLPLPPLTAYVVNRFMKLVPVGVPGELLVGGAGVGRGYLNRPPLTAEKFYRSDWSNRSYLSYRTYRTGDLVKLTAGGELVYLGRIDHQVKIRGFRIETGEIENRLRSHDAIKETVVIARQNESGEKFLCAYYIPVKRGETVNVTELREFLSVILPDYMIPSYFMGLEAFPLTSNQKINRKALPEPDHVRPSVETEFLTPQTELEQMIADQWKKVLKLDRIGIYDNFFELGGDSLKAITLIARMQKELNVRVSPTDFFMRLTVRGLAEHIQNAGEEIYTAIEPAEEEEYYPLSSPQKRMYILNLFTEYTIPLFLEVGGNLDKDRVEWAIQELIKRHESLRTSFYTINGEAVQEIHGHVDFKIEYDDLAAENLEQSIEDRNREILGGVMKPFDLSRAPLLRVRLIKLPGNKHLLMLNIHHIIADGFSLRIMGMEFSRLYRQEELPGVNIGYKDFSRWNNRMLQGELYRKQEAYWSDVFSGELPVLNMALDFPRPAMQSFEGRIFTFYIEGDVFRSLKKLSLLQEASIYMVMLAVCNTLLYRYTGQEDIVIGTISAGREHRDVENMVGIFINPLALRNFPGETKTFRDFLKELKQDNLEAHENQMYPFGDLLEKVVTKKDHSRNPLFDFMLIFQNRDTGSLEVEGLHFSLYESEPESGNQPSGHAQQDITLWANEEEDRVRIDLEYCSALFKPETMERFAGHFLTLLKSAAVNPASTLSELEIITGKEKQRLEMLLNTVDSSFPTGKTFHGLFEEQVERTPDRTAVTVSSQEITYRELNRRAGGLAGVLSDRGVKPGDIVAIMPERSIEMFIGILGVLKAGGAYLPVDPAYPADRIDYMLADSAAKVLLIKPGPASIDRNRIHAPVVLNLENSDFEKGCPCRGRASDLSPTSPAYVIYTSGSTGRPKGVVVGHDNFVNAAYGWIKEYRLDEIDVNLLQVAGFSFDVFSGDMARAFLYGGRLVVCPEEVRIDFPVLYKLVRDRRITLFESTPALILPFMEYVNDNRLELPHLQLLILGSDVCPRGEFDRLVRRYAVGDGHRMRIINSYGVTEATIDSSYYEESPGVLPGESGPIPIGKPLPNVFFLILDPAGNLQPVGIPGELYIGGSGVARGYLNNPGLTAERFNRTDRSDRSNRSYFSYRTYRSGDLARWLDDGNVEFLGRCDDQVKIRGFRIEIKEIEKQLLALENIKEAVVLDKKDKNGSKFLCGYVVPMDPSGVGPGDSSFTVSGLREFLTGQLPDYMIPSHFIEIEKIPLTPNGKIDKKALCALEGGIETGTEYVPHTNEIEKKLADIWSEILLKDRIGINDNFFALGGQSILAMRVVSKIREVLNVDIPLISFFQVGTIRGIAEIVTGSLPDANYLPGTIKAVEKKEFYKLSSAQKRMYILQQLDLESAVYNVSKLIPLEEKIDKDQVGKVFSKIIHRHESLRTSFFMREDEPVQRIHEDAVVPIRYYDFIPRGADGVKAIVANFVRPFDLSTVPLLRVGLIKLEEEKLVLLLDMHHIVIDEISNEILTGEFMALYRGEELPPLRIQYKDYAEWQNSEVEKGSIIKQEEYWLREFEGDVPLLNLPTDYERPDVLGFQGSLVSFTVDPGLTAKIRKHTSQMGVTLLMYLLAAYKILLWKYTGQEDIVVGTVITGRNHKELEGIIGFFVNMLAIRTAPSRDITVLGYLMDVKEKAVNAYENQGFQFEELVSKLKIPRQSGRHPLVDTVFVLRDGSRTKDAATDGTGFDLFEVSHFDLLLHVTAAADSLRMVFEYSTDLFKKSTIEWLADAYIDILEQIAANRDLNLPLSDIQIQLNLLTAKSDIFREYTDDWDV